MSTFKFTNISPEFVNDYGRFAFSQSSTVIAKEIQESLEFTSLTGKELPDNVINHFKNVDPEYTLFDNEVISLSEYNKQFPNNTLLQNQKALDYFKETGSAVEVTDFFGNKETYILAHNLREYDKLRESTIADRFDEFLKPFINASPSLIISMPDVACDRIMANYINNQPDFLHSSNFIPKILDGESPWATPTHYFNESELKKHVADIAGSILVGDIGFNKYNLGISEVTRDRGYTSTYHEKELYHGIKSQEHDKYNLLLSACKEKGVPPNEVNIVVRQIIKEATSQCRNFELQYNEQRREFDKSQPFKNPAFDLVDKLSDKFNQAVQGLKKVWQVVTTKNLAIEQSKDKQQTVQPQKNTPEVKQQSKAKDMER